MSVVLAHQGGWDEILVVLAPIVVFGLLLHLANRRAKAAMGSDDEGETGPSSAE